jgi:hypothetical protein
MGIIVNTAIGNISALPHEANKIKSLTDEHLLAAVDLAEIADPYEFQEVLNRGLYSRTARYKAYYGASRGNRGE